MSRDAIHSTGATGGGRERERGSVLLLTAIMLTALLATVGLVVDLGNGRQQRRNLQNYADAAALAAINELVPKFSHTAPDADAVAAAAASLAANGVAPSASWVNHPPVSGNHVGDPDCVEVRTELDVGLTFAAVISDSPLTVSARAVGCLEDLITSVPVIFGAAPSCSNNVKLTASGVIDGGLHSNADINFGSNFIKIIDVTSYSSGPPQNDGNITYDPPRPANPVATPLQQMPYELSSADIDAIVGAAAAAGVLHDAGSSAIDSSWLGLPSAPGESPRIEIVDGRPTLGSGVYLTTADPPGAGKDAIVVPSSIAMNGDYTFIAVNGAVQLNAGPGSVTRAWDKSDKHLLVYSGKSNSCGSDVVTVTGSDSLWSGVIFAPNGSVNMSLSCSSASSTPCDSADNPAYTGAVMAWSVNLSGSGAYITGLDDLTRTIRGPLLKE